jgi:hypothetical protein
MNRHIGGSILPSSDAQVLQTKTGEHGVFQVRVLPELDTHAVYFARTAADLGADEVMIASHPNGYSCDTLAKRTIAAWTDGQVDHALGQFDHIITCGGRGLERDIVEALARGEVEQLFDALPSLSH